MKRVVISIVGGLAIVLLISAGIKNDKEFLNADSKTEGKHSLYVSNESIGNIELTSVIGVPNKKTSLKIEDVKVFEMEEELELGFDTSDYLPIDFNPVKGMEAQHQLNYEGYTDVCENI